LDRYGFLILFALMFIPVGNTNVLQVILGFLVSIGGAILGL
jgi:hypothetical protein